MRTALFLCLFVCGAGYATLPELHGTDWKTGQSVAWSPTSNPSVIVFLSPTCPCSRAHEGKLSELARKNPDVGFLGIVSGKAMDGAAEHFRQSTLPFPVIGQSTHAWADAFGALNTPHAFLISHGEVVYRGGVDDSRVSGRASRHYLQDALADLKNGRKISRPEARAVGCAIRR